MMSLWSLVLSSFLSLCLAVYGWLARTACSGHWLTRPILRKGNASSKNESRPTPKYQLTMGLCRSKKTWLDVDENYLIEHRVRQTLLETRNRAVTGCTAVAEAAAEELLDVVVEHLIDNYPECFQRMGHGTERECVKSTKLDQVFYLRRPHRSLTALETAGLLAMEDFNILMKDPTTNDHVLQGSVTCFPVGWSVDARLGWPLYKIHSGVPQWQQKLRKPVEHFLSTVSTKATVERNPYFVQVADLERMDLGGILCQVVPLPVDTIPTHHDHIIIRHERQTFRRLPDSKAVIFSVKTRLRKLAELSKDELRVFRKEVTSWPDEVALYKGRNGWGKCALAYCSSVIGDEG